MQSTCFEAEIAVTLRDSDYASYHLPSNAPRHFPKARCFGGHCVQIADASTDKLSVLTLPPMQIMNGLNQVNVRGYISDNQ